MSHSTTVWILAAEGSWFVGIGAGYYARPLTRREAISEARRLACKAASRYIHGQVIEIRGPTGQVIERIHATSSASVAPPDADARAA